MDDKPRYSRVADVVELIIFMLSKFNGVTLSEIQERFNISRRTAERMRDCAMAVLPQIDEIETDGRTKRWGFTNYSLNELVNFTPEDISFLENLKTDEYSKQMLDEILTKIKAIRHKKFDSTQDIDVELLLETEGMAIRQHSNYKFDTELLSLIRKAIKENKKIQVEYKDKLRTLSPLGLIFGERIHLVAREEAKSDGEFDYLLHKIKNVKITDENFNIGNFNLQEYSQKSFGVYQGEIYNVKLQFIPESAEDVLNYYFHPTQKFKQLEDGSVIVTFQASGEKHIIWNILRWGYAVKILAPIKLKKEFKKYLDDIITLYVP